MSTPIAIACIAVSIVLGRILLFHFQVWLESSDESYGFVRMRYKEFKPLYDIAPHNYELYRFKEKGPCVRYVHDHDEYFIYFCTCFEWIKAKLIFLKEENRYIKRVRLIDKKAFLKRAQEDIDRFTEKMKGET